MSANYWLSKEFEDGSKLEVTQLRDKANPFQPEEPIVASPLALADLWFLNLTRELVNVFHERTGSAPYTLVVGWDLARAAFPLYRTDRSKLEGAKILGLNLTVDTSHGWMVEVR